METVYVHWMGRNRLGWCEEGLKEFLQNSFIKLHFTVVSHFLSIADRCQLRYNMCLSALARCGSVSSGENPLSLVFAKRKVKIRLVSSLSSYDRPIFFKKKKVMKTLVNYSTFCGKRFKTFFLKDHSMSFGVSFGWLVF